MCVFVLEKCCFRGGWRNKGSCFEVDTSFFILKMMYMFILTTKISIITKNKQNYFFIFFFFFSPHVVGLFGLFFFSFDY